MTTQDPLQTFVDTLSSEQRAAFLLLNQTRTAELQAAVTAATAALTKLYAEFNCATNLVQLLNQAAEPPVMNGLAP